MVARCVKWIATVDYHLHLGAHLVIIDRCGPADYVGVVHFLDDFAHVVILDNAYSAALAAVEFFGAILCCAG